MLNKIQLDSLSPDDEVIDQIRIIANAVAKELHNIVHKIEYTDYAVRDILIASILWNKTREALKK